MNLTQSYTYRQNGRVFALRQSALSPGDEVIRARDMQFMWGVVVQPHIVRAADLAAAVSLRDRLATAGRIVTEGFWTQADLDAFLDRFSRAVERLS